jgi:hypothetical protein
VSIQCPEDWTVEESDVTDKIRYLADFFPKNGFLTYGVNLNIDNYGLAKKSIEEISEFLKYPATSFSPGPLLQNPKLPKLTDFQLIKFFILKVLVEIQF